MHAGEVGIGAMLAGFGTVFVVVALMYTAPVLIPFSYILIGAGLALFLRGFAHDIPWSLAFLLALGATALPLSAFLLVTRRNVPDGLALASLSLGWSLALIAIGLYRQAATPAHRAAPVGPVRAQRR